MGAAKRFAVSARSTPALTSAQWATDYNEIKNLGGTNSTTRTAEQTDIALFIIDLPGYTMNSVAKQVVAARNTALVDTARVFALMHMAGDDAVYAVFEAKYAYNFWRPVTAIGAGDTDGNDATTPEADWLPLRVTPPHPEYPCAHCTVSGAMAAVLAAIFGDDFTFTLETASQPGKPRTFRKFSEYAALSLEGRLYAGFHYRFSSVVGADQGQKVGAYVFNHSLTPGPTLSGQLQAGEFRLTPRNRGSLQHRIEVSSDLLKWSTLANYTSTDLTVQILDKDAGGVNHKFYRAVAP